MGEVVDSSKDYGARPIGPLRDKRFIDISAADHVDKRGFIVEVSKAGDLTYRAVAGDADQTETLEAGGSIRCAGVPVKLEAVRASAAIGLIAAGYQ